MINYKRRNCKKCKGKPNNNFLNLKVAILKNKLSNNYFM